MTSCKPPNVGDPPDPEFVTQDKPVEDDELAARTFESAPTPNLS